MTEINFSTFAPVTKAAMAAEAAQAATGPSASPSGPKSEAEPAFRIVGGPARSRVVTLTYPIGHDGFVLDTIVVRRMTVSEVRDFMRAAAEDEAVHLPMFETLDGQPVPAAALDALDHDDWAVLDRVALDFLPLALRGVLGSAPAPLTGAGSQA